MLDWKYNLQALLLHYVTSEVHLKSPVKQRTMIIWKSCKNRIFAYDHSFLRQIT